MTAEFLLLLQRGRWVASGPKGRSGTVRARLMLPLDPMPPPVVVLVRLDRILSSQRGEALYTVRDVLATDGATGSAPWGAE